jgi:hypothetical protein
MDHAPMQRRHADARVPGQRLLRQRGLASRSAGAALATLVLALAGCASIDTTSSALAAPSAADAQCLQAFSALDERVERAGVRDAQDDRIEGFAWLRVNRLLAALAPRARASDAAFSTWVERLQSLDAAARRIELANLPPAERESTGDRFEACARQLSDSLHHNAAARETLLRNARVPDRYSSAARAVGLYPLVRWPFFAGVSRWQDAHADAMREAAAAPRPARRFAPDPVHESAAVPAQRRFTLDALGLPIVSADRARQLLAAHAPVFEIETSGAFDTFGAPRWRDDGRIEVDALRPVVYERLTHTVVEGQALLQLVYTLWFPERPASGPTDLLAGALDGVIVRITLDTDGRPILLDTIHACGCYHLFFPSARLRPRPGAPTDEEWAFAPAALPDAAPPSRLVVGIASRTHYVLGVGAMAPGQGLRPGDTVYALDSEDRLRRLPVHGTTATRSLYGPDGLVAGTERGERFFFWPMGIASAGAMRQWGHHATAFVGRRHFDDADLIERRFILDAGN